MGFMTTLLGHAVFYTLATLGLTRCIITGIIYGGSSLTPQQKSQLAKARQQFWSLSKAPLSGFTHAFHHLSLGKEHGKKIHYIHNRHNVSQPQSLVIFIHGFPDSCLLWKSLLSYNSQSQNQALSSANHIVCVDLPGYGGSDSFEVYDVRVLDAMVEFCVSMRELSGCSRVVLVAHDWGCTLATRLMNEAPGVADRFVLINGLFADLAISNFTHHINSLPTLLLTTPLKAMAAIWLLTLQTWKFAYVATFDLPEQILGYILGEWNNAAVLRGILNTANSRNGEFDIVDSLVVSLGPDLAAAGPTNSSDGLEESYGSTIIPRATAPAKALWNMTGLYRNGVLRGEWPQSSLQKDKTHSVRPPATVIWGLNDHVMESEICLDGLLEGRHLAPGSQVITLPGAGHWVPVERVCVPLLDCVLGCLVRQECEKGQGGERLDGRVLKERYKGARIVGRT